MKMPRKIRKMLVAALWLASGSGLAVLLLAAVNARNHQVCKGYDIVIHDDAVGTGFIDKSDVLRVLTANTGGSLRNRSIGSFNLGRIESQLKNQVWIRDADLYFDNRGILKIDVDEREPIARVFTAMGESFYLDSSGHRLPLSDKASARLPVFTGFPLASGKWKTAADRKLVQQMRDMSLYLLHSPFWMAQVSQIDITPARQFEIVPTIGDHIVELGDANDLDAKFNRLYLFYREVLATSGMNKYQRIKIQFDNQIVAVKKMNNN